MLLSGGVDSTVCAALVNKALEDDKDKIFALHIDNGFMREGESDAVLHSLERLGLPVTVIRAGHDFLNGDTFIKANDNGSSDYKTDLLCYTIDPEEKRKIIGDTFIAVTKRALADHLGLDFDNVLLVQGTLRPDLIESASGLVSDKADVIKTHHNDTDLVRKLRSEGRVIEPLADFHKDEVRKMGAALGLPEDIVKRHPYPGPGLAIRVLCQNEPFSGKDFAETQVLCKLVVNYGDMVKREHALLNRIDAAINSESEREKLFNISKKRTYNATLLPIRTVGVQGDGRTYSYAVTISTNDDVDDDWTDLAFLAKAIPKVCHNVNRVCFAFGKAIEHTVTDVTPTHLRPRVIETLRMADRLANATLTGSECYGKLSQMPVVLIPVHFDRSPVERAPSFQRSVVIRTFITNDFMTGVPAIPGQDLPIAVLKKMVSEILTVPGISRILYDLTAKPPGTTEWE